MATLKSINLKYKGKKIKVNVRKCNVFQMVRGLMFKDKKSAKALLLLDFKKPQKAGIHSFFVFFKFLAVWLDDKNSVVETRIIKPWKPLIIPENKFHKLVEIPFNNKYREILKILVGKKDLNITTNLK